MTALQMKYEFEIGYELANLFSRSYNEKEISTLLTQAQTQIVNEVIDSEYSEMKDILIKNLKVNYNIGTTVYVSKVNCVETTTVPDDILKPLTEHATITLTSTNSFYNINTSHEITNVPVKPITEDYYNANINNPDKQPYEKLIWRMFTASKILLFGGSTFSPTRYYLDYIKRPNPIIIQYANYITADGSIDGEYFEDYKTTSLDCELDDFFHRKVVDRAILIALEAAGNQRLQTKSSIT